ncbi:hypothetical protein EYR40_006088 [Pleurotus pulmonarius]|nr:hypothetical protein EYR38_003095 [Pleurotus pulmonarius]KAF4599000.1 hypothetical protein EYR40_006088 [Pleurotus pulmonarius]
MLGAAHAQLFVIGYTRIVAKLEEITLYNSWAFDRIICICDYARTLPDGFLSSAEKERLMRWGIKYWEELAVYGAAPLDDIDSDTIDASASSSEELEERERGLVSTLAAYEDQSFHVYKYANTMPSLHAMARAKTCSPALRYEIVHRLRDQPLDAKRVARIESVLLRFDPYEIDMDDAVLVNTTKRQCVWAVNEGGERVLDVAIPLLTVWADREGAYKMEGQWAGDRLAIISQDEFEDILDEEDGWKEKKRAWWKGKDKEWLVPRV